LKTNLTYIAALSVLILSSCGASSENQHKGPIVLGDSATIVTEKDSQYLKDEVMDIEPRRVQEVDTAVPLPQSKEQTAVPAKDTAVVAKQHQPEENGQAIDFGGAKMVLSGLRLKESRKQNTIQEEGLSYSLNSGNLGTSKLVVYGAKNITIKQRYQSKLILKSSLGTVDLRDLGLYTSGWNNVSGSNAGNAQSFGLASLSRIAYAQVNNNKIKNAADRELRKRRTNSRTIQSWMKEIKRVRSGNDRPCEIILDNVQWQISGTDEKGKPFRKTIRVDA
jgi:hypothetical protein